MEKLSVSLGCTIAQQALTTQPIGHRLYNLPRVKSIEGGASNSLILKKPIGTVGGLQIRFPAITTLATAIILQLP